MEKSRPEWAGKYVDYKALKDLIKASAQEYEQVSWVVGVGGAAIWSGDVLHSWTELAPHHHIMGALERNGCMSMHANNRKAA